MASTSRDYQAVVDQLKPIGARDPRMRAVVDALWVAFENHGYSWVGFYIDRPHEPDEKRLVLSWRRDKLAVFTDRPARCVRSGVALQETAHRSGRD